MEIPLGNIEYESCFMKMHGFMYCLNWTDFVNEQCKEIYRSFHTMERETEEIDTHNQG